MSALKNPSSLWCYFLSLEVSRVMAGTLNEFKSCIYPPALDCMHTLKCTDRVWTRGARVRKNVVSGINTFFSICTFLHSNLKIF